MAVNPAYAGNSEKVCATLINRKDWFGFGDTPLVLAANINSPFKLFNRSHGVGLSFINDRGLGFSNILITHLSYAYKADVGPGKLAIGINGGIYNNVLKSPNWNPPQSQDDPILTQIKESNYNQISFDLGLGLFYKSENLYAGISGLHLNKPKLFKTDDPIQNQLHFYITAGYDIQLTNPLFVLKPSIFINTGGTMSKLDINALIEYNKKIWGGVTYKTGAAIVGLFGLELFNGVRIGMAYDLGTNALGAKYGTGSYEILINYCFNLKVEKKPQHYKSVRFL